MYYMNMDIIFNRLNLVGYIFFVIGIPSFIGCGIYLIKRFDYFNLPWEKWADELGGVNR